MMNFPILKIKSLKTHGLQDEEITIEALKSRGLQQIQLIGLPDVWLRDVREKIRSIVSLLVPWGTLDRILIHLLPAGTEKCGAHLELPIALASIAILQNDLDSVTLKLLSEYYFVGALNLQGEILPTAETQAWEKLSNQKVIGPSRYKNLQHLWHDLLIGELKEGFQKNRETETSQDLVPFWNPLHRTAEQYWIWLCYLAGLPVLLLGPPGVGKTYLAKWSEQLLYFKNPLEEATANRIWSLANLPLPERPPVIKPIPRSHFSEFSGMQRQGVMRPGYFSLSHKGMMILDEFCEFSRDCREILRNILDEKQIHQNTKSGQVTWPADFFLILTSNPCPCGMSRPQDLSRCKCLTPALKKYQSRISGPLFDRMGVRLFLDHSPEALPLPKEYLSIPKNLAEVKETASRVQKLFSVYFEDCVSLIRDHSYLSKLSQREQVNKAKLLTVLSILTDVPQEKLLLVLQLRSQNEEKLNAYERSNTPCSPFGNVSAAQV